MSTDDGVTVWVARDGGQPEVIYQHQQDGGLAAMSRDESLLVISHSEHGDSRHPALRVVRTDGTTVAEKWDGPGKGLDALEFAPVPGDPRLLVVHERRGKEELLIWDVVADTETELHLDLPGEVVADWYPDGKALLIAHTYRARTTVHRYDLESGVLTALPTPAGTVVGATVRPDRSVEYVWSSAESPSLVRTISAEGDDRVLLTPPGERAPGSVPVSDVFVEVPYGPNDSVHALVAKPEGAGDGPMPTVFNLHGGPHAADEDRFSAYRAAWLDAGFAAVEQGFHRVEVVRACACARAAFADQAEGEPEAKGGEGEAEGNERGHGKRPALWGRAMCLSSPGVWARAW